MRHEQTICFFFQILLQFQRNITSLGGETGL